MKTIDWPSILRAVIDTGMTQVQIGEQCGCTQSTVNDVLKGRARDPRATTGLRLLALARQRGVPVPVDVTWPAADAGASNSEASHAA